MVDDLPSLITRLRAATGPDRGLDADIYCLTHPDWTWDRSTQQPTGWISMVDKRGIMKPSPIFTGSTDAAMTLMSPDHWWLMVKGRTRANEPVYKIIILEPDLDAEIEIARAEHETSLPICICMAALEARGL